jgi:hypothetical protein
MSTRRCRKRKRVEPTPTTGNGWYRSSSGPSKRELRGDPATGAFRGTCGRACRTDTGVSERTLYRRVEGFEHEGMESLFATEKARRERDCRPR